MIATAETYEVLAIRLPEWFVREIGSYALAHGMTPESFAAVVLARSLLPGRDDLAEEMRDVADEGL